MACAVVRSWRGAFSDQPSDPLRVRFESVPWSNDPGAYPWQRPPGLNVGARRRLRLGIAWQPFLDFRSFAGQLGIRHRFDIAPMADQMEKLAIGQRGGSRITAASWSSVHSASGRFQGKRPRRSSSFTIRPVMRRSTIGPCLQRRQPRFNVRRFDRAPLRFSTAATA